MNTENIPASSMFGGPQLTKEQMQNPEFLWVQFIPTSRPDSKFCGTFQWGARGVGFGEVAITREIDSVEENTYTYTIDSEMMSREFVKNMIAYFVDNAQLADDE
jgi:hypothetical protein